MTGWLSAGKKARLGVWCGVEWYGVVCVVWCGAEWCDVGVCVCVCVCVCV